jgi:hypothetical protein
MIMRRQTEPVLEDESPLFEIPFAWLMPASELKNQPSEEDELGFRALLEDPEILLDRNRGAARDDASA